MYVLFVFKDGYLFVFGCPYLWLWDYWYFRCTRLGGKVSGLMHYFIFPFHLWFCFFGCNCCLSLFTIYYVVLLFIYWHLSADYGVFFGVYCVLHHFHVIACLSQIYTFQVLFVIRGGFCLLLKRGFLLFNVQSLGNWSDEWGIIIIVILGNLKFIDRVNCSI